jgi:hypothetical protein
VLLRALDVVLGRSPRPESSTDRKEAKRAKATRLAAVYVASESGIPADRGSFGASARFSESPHQAQIILRLTDW